MTLHGSCSTAPGRSPTATQRRDCPGARRAPGNPAHRPHSTRTGPELGSAPPPASIGPAGRRQVKRIESPTRAGGGTRPAGPPPPPRCPESSLRPERGKPQGNPSPDSPRVPLTFPPHPHSLPLRAHPVKVKVKVKIRVKIKIKSPRASGPSRGTTPSRDRNQSYRRTPQPRN